MGAIRKIVDGNRLTSVIDLPDDMKNRKVEIIVMPVSEDTLSKNVGSMKGYLKIYANPELTELEKGAWERAAAEKHGHF